MPCGHGGYCNTCALALFENGLACPVCRSTVELVCRVALQLRSPTRDERSPDQSLQKVVDVWEIEEEQEMQDGREGGGE